VPGRLVGDVVTDPTGGIVSLFDRGAWSEVRRIADILRIETVGGCFFSAQR
jgi:hypothetical protein